MSEPGTGTTAVSTVTFVVPEDTEPQRLDRFLVSVLPEHSRSQIQRLIEDGHVTVDGRAAKANLRLKAGSALFSSESDIWKAWPGALSGAGRRYFAMVTLMPPGLLWIESRPSCAQGAMATCTELPIPDTPITSEPRQAIGRT